ncbi:hypothetical protein [Reyranella sp.]|uniref:hypothetical protein n=1 Tax=Reyranella sp. TaxID=1929291 RepID=UPI0011FC652A|nr:hypothetical protein [Reyranella sp.]TAJ85391.1 MAG: hypothetical protein EPO50_16590 [Reyranella sp.]
MLEKAALVVACFGYSSITLPVLDQTGAPLTLAANAGSAAVGEDCNLLSAQGCRIDRVFGIALEPATACPPARPPARMGGEPTFDGQCNSLWLYQNDIGATMYRAILRLTQALPEAFAAE